MTTEMHEMPLEEENRLWDIVDSFFDKPSKFNNMSNKLVIPVSSKHFKDNTYQHGNDRRCPLSEAIEAELGKIHLVGATRVYENIFKELKPQYLIPYDKWNAKTVTEYIEQANKGEEFTVFVELTKIEQ